MQIFCFQPIRAVSAATPERLATFPGQRRNSSRANHPEVAPETGDQIGRIRHHDRHDVPVPEHDANVGQTERILPGIRQMLGGLQERGAGDAILPQVRARAPRIARRAKKGAVFERQFQLMIN